MAIDKFKLLADIMHWYNYELSTFDGCVIVSQGSDIRLSYESVDAALIDFLGTLEATNAETSTDDHVWSNEEIEFIKSLKQSVQEDKDASRIRETNKFTI